LSSGVLEELLGRIAADVCLIFLMGGSGGPTNIAIADCGEAVFPLFFMTEASRSMHQRAHGAWTQRLNCKDAVWHREDPATITFAICLDPGAARTARAVLEHTLEQMRQHGPMKDLSGSAGVS